MSNSKPDSNIERLLTPSIVSEILGISEGTLQVWRTTGRGNLSFVKVGGKVMYRPEDVQDFINRRLIQHTL